MRGIQFIDQVYAFSTLCRRMKEVFFHVEISDSNALYETCLAEMYEIKQH